MARSQALPAGGAAQPACRAWRAGAGGLRIPGATETLTLELGELSRLKLAAISRHVSQTGSEGPFHDWTPEMRDGFLATEHYRLAASNLPVAAGGAPPVRRETSIWDGLTA